MMYKNDNKFNNSANYLSIKYWLGNVGMGKPLITAIVTHS